MTEFGFYCVEKIVRNCKNVGNRKFSPFLRNVLKKLLLQDHSNLRFCGKGLKVCFYHTHPSLIIFKLILHTNLELSKNLEQLADNNLNMVELMDYFIKG